MTPTLIAALRVAVARMIGLFASGQRDAELRDELESHLEMETAENVRRGMPPDVARRAALIAAGGMTVATEDYREQRGLPFVERFAQDLRFGARMLRRSPSFAIVAIVAVGIAIGINAGFFTLVDAFMWRPIPVTNPSRVVKLLIVNAEGSEGIRFSYTDYLSLSRNSKTLEDVVAYEAQPVALRASSRANGARSASAGFVSGNYFQALGGRNALLGRLLRPDDDQPDAPPAIVIGEALWESAFERSPTVIGGDALINGVHVTIVGVVSRRFVGINPLTPDLWMPVRVAERVGGTTGKLSEAKNRFLVLHARVRPGVTYARSEAELSGLIAEPPAPAGTRAALARITGVRLMANASMVPFNLQTSMMLAPALLVVALVLAIACANVGNVLLSRALVRQREFAVRLALGASRARLVRQLLTESLLVGLLGGALGLLLSSWTVTVAGRAFFASVPTTYGTVMFELTTSWRVVGCTTGLAFASVMLFGLAPALQGSSPIIASALKGEDVLLGSRLRRSSLRDALVSIQVAACLVLLAAAGILVQSLRQFAVGDTGLAPNGVLVANIGVTPSIRSPSLASSRAEFSARVAKLPGVVATARAAQAPFTGWPLIHVAAQRHGAAPDPLRALPYNVVTPGYFDVVGQRIVEGRRFMSADSATDAPVVIVTRAAALTLWPRVSPLGQMLRIFPNTDGPGSLYHVVGVARDAHSGIIWDSDGAGYVFLPATSKTLATLDMPVLIKGSGAPGATLDLTRRVADIANQVNADAPLQSNTLLESYALQMLPFRYAAAIVTGIGVLGLALALVGLYGVVSFSVTQRQREIAVRVAMGAPGRDIVQLVLRREMRLVLAGLAIGVVLAAVESKLIGSLVIPLAPLSVGGSAILTSSLLVVALAATVIPALRALRISPMDVLRHD